MSLNLSTFVVIETPSIPFVFAPLFEVTFRTAKLRAAKLRISLFCVISILWESFFYKPLVYHAGALLVFFDYTPNLFRHNF